MIKITMRIVALADDMADASAFRKAVTDEANLVAGSRNMVGSVVSEAAEVPETPKPEYVADRTAN